MNRCRRNIVNKVLWSVAKVSEVLKAKGFVKTADKVDFFHYCLWYPISKL